MDVCILDQGGEILLPRQMQRRPDAWLNAMAPDRDPLVVAAACRFTWYGLAELCAAEGLPFGLGQALSRKAIPGGTANNDTIDAQNLAVLRRGGMRPQASGYPAARRATRDRRRRRRPLAPTRGELLAHVPHPNRPDHVPALGHNIASTAHRDGVADRFAAPAVHTRLAVALWRIDDYAPLRRDCARALLNAAQHQDAHPRDLLRTVPGRGQIRRLVRFYAIHALDRCPRGQAFASAGRLGKGAKESAGNRSGTAGTPSGHAHLPWAVSDAAVCCRRDPPAGQQCLVN